MFLLFITKEDLQKQIELNLSFKKQLHSCFSPPFYPPLSTLQTDLPPDPVSPSLTVLFESLNMFLLISSNLFHAHPPLHHQNALRSHEGGLLLLLHFNGKAFAWKPSGGCHETDRFFRSWTEATKCCASTASLKIPELLSVLPPVRLFASRCSFTCFVFFWLPLSQILLPTLRCLLRRSSLLLNASFFCQLFFSQQMYLPCLHPLFFFSAPVSVCSTSVFFFFFCSLFPPLLSLHLYSALPRTHFPLHCVFSLSTPLPAAL